MNRMFALLPLGLFLSVAGSAPAMAQSKHDSSAPIDFGAQHMQLDDRANRVLLSGAVKITQGEMTLNAARVTVSYTGQIVNGSPQVSRLDAAGGVTVTRPDQSANGQYAVYDLNRRVITMVGGVTLRQGPNVIQGARLSINLDTGHATIDGSGVGGSTGAAGPATGVQSSGGRVTGRFSVPKRTDQPQ